MSWNPWATISKLASQIKELNEKCGFLESAKQEAIDILRLITTERDEIKEKASRESEMLAEANILIEEIYKALDEFKPSDTPLKSNKALRIELESAKLAIAVAKKLADRQ